MVQPPSEPQWPAYRAGEQPVPAGYPTEVPRRPGYAADDPLVLAAGGSTLKKEGSWTVPPYLRIQGDLGSVKLDFRRAQLVSQVVWVDVSGGVGSILMILPEGWAAQTDRLRPGIGTLKSRVAEDQASGLPVLVLSGSLGVGSLSLRYPTPRDIRRLNRQLRKQQPELR